MAYRTKRGVEHPDRARADDDHALRSNRCFRPALSQEKSREIILEGCGSHFDPDVVGAFRELETTFKSLSEAAPN
jgi:putative two-component system response regulator